MKVSNLPIHPVGQFCVQLVRRNILLYLFLSRISNFCRQFVTTLLRENQDFNGTLIHVFWKPRLSSANFKLPLHSLDFARQTHTKLRGIRNKNKPHVTFYSQKIRYIQLYNITHISQKPFCLNSKTKKGGHRNLAIFSLFFKLKSVFNFQNNATTTPRFLETFLTLLTSLDWATELTHSNAAHVKLTVFMFQLFSPSSQSNKYQLVIMQLQ